MNTWKLRFARLLEVRHADPDQARRGRLLNILLLGLAALSGLGLIGDFITGQAPEAASLIILVPACEIAIAGLFALNRRSPRWAAWLFLIGLLVAISFSDTPHEVFSGRTTALLVVPIFASSLLLFPTASFIMTALASVVLLLLALAFHLQEPYSLIYTGGILVLTALVSWLASNSLESALADLRQLEERTRSILDSITDGVLAIAVTDQAVIIDANPSAAQLLKCAAPADLIGQELEHVLGEAAPEDWQIIRSTFQQEAAVAEWPVQLGRLVLTATIVPLRAPRANTSRTEKRLLLTLRNSTREAEAERLRDEFSTLLRQGIQTPLGIIEVLGEDLGKPQSSAARQSTAESLLGQVRRLKQTISALLDRDQLSRRRLDVQLAVASLPPCLEEIAQNVRSQTLAQGVRVLLDHLPLSPDQVTTDRHLLVQAGSNLVYHLLAQTQAEEILVRVGRKDLTHWLLQVTDYSTHDLPYGPLLSSTVRVTAEPTVNWLLAEQLVAALHGELQVGQNGKGQTLIQVLFDGLGASGRAQ